MMSVFMPVIGLLAMVAVSWALSENRKKINWSLVAAMLVVQIILGVLVLGIPRLGIVGPLRPLFEAANVGITAILDYTQNGARFLFGNLLDAKSYGFIFAFSVLPTIIFFSSLLAILYHVGIMQWIVKGLAIGLQKVAKISGAESLSTAANIFLGQTEAPLVVKPYIKNMTRSELFCVMVGGMANTAGGVLAAYVGMLRDRIPDIGGHLLTASILSAPAAIMISKMMVPESEAPETSGSMPKIKDENLDTNVIEAATRGASEGLYLALNVAAMLVAFIALVSMADGILGYVGNAMNFASWGKDLVSPFVPNPEAPQLSLSIIFGWIFSPFAWLIGVPANEVLAAGGLLGEKVSLNEFVAYSHLADMMANLSDRTVLIMSYALSGFANIGSIGIQVGGIGVMAPSRRGDLAKMGLKAVVAGTMCTMMIAALAAILF
jgi:CNT family concentrative nucleoside transporter